MASIDSSAIMFLSLLLDNIQTCSLLLVPHLSNQPKSAHLHLYQILSRISSQMSLKATLNSYGGTHSPSRHINDTANDFVCSRFCGIHIFNCRDSTLTQLSYHSDSAEFLPTIHLVSASIVSRSHFIPGHIDEQQ